ncbi:MAG: CCA tRNA nucleotidyltransferase [Xanthobacteraceae bacterium]|nr:CCA tRNA nucleotidyltransferase [Xanthobacteraceae bacterium]
MTSAPAQRKLAADQVAFLKVQPLADVLAALNGAGEETRVVGGAVRNLLFGLPLHEVDLATTAEPKKAIERVTAAGMKVVPTGIEHGTVTVVADGRPFEVTTLREDVETDGRHAVVRFGRDWKQDAERRDFTINAMSLSSDGIVHDYCGGLSDVEKKRVRFIGDADQRIAEDYLRVLRFFRFFAAYGEGEPDREGYLACARARDKLDQLSRERIRAEIMKLLVAKRAPEAMIAMADTGIYDHVFANAPELPALARLALIERSNEIVPDAVRRLAAVAVRLDEDAAHLRERLRLSNDEYKRLVSMGDRWWQLTPASGEAYAKETLYRIGADEYSDRALISFAHSDASLADEKWGALLSLPQSWTAPRFPLSAEDFIKRGVEKGPKLGKTLAAAETAWIAANFPEDAASLEKIVDAAIL